MNSCSELGTVIGKLVGARLRELRKDAEFTQADVARRMGSHREIIARIERGKHETSLEIVEGFARALSLDAATVLVCLDLEWIAAGQRVRREAA